MSRKIIIFVIAVALASVAAGAGAAPPTVERPTRIVEGRDGLYTIQDRSIACRVHGGWIACDNGRVVIACKDDRCSAHYNDDNYPDELRVYSQEDANKPGVRVLRPGDLLELGRMGCFASATHIQCRVIDYLGGFQMSGLFARNNNWDDAPDGWPWDGHRYTVKDRVPGI